MITVINWIPDKNQGYNKLLLLICSMSSNSYKWSDSMCINGKLKQGNLLFETPDKNTFEIQSKDNFWLSHVLFFKTTCKIIPSTLLDAMEDMLAKSTWAL